MLGKKTTRTPKKCPTGFLMVKRYRVGFLDPKEAGGASPRWTVLEAVYIRSLRGMVRLIDGGSDRSPGLGVAG